MKTFETLLNKIDLKEDRHLFENAPIGRFLDYISFSVDDNEDWLDCSFVAIAENTEEVLELKSIEITEANLTGDFLSTKQLQELELTITKLINEL